MWNVHSRLVTLMQSSSCNCSVYVCVVSLHCLAPATITVSVCHAQASGFDTTRDRGRRSPSADRQGAAARSRSNSRSRVSSLERQPSSAMLDSPARKRGVSSSRVAEQWLRQGVTAFHGAFQEMWEGDGRLDYATGQRYTVPSAVPPGVTSSTSSKGMFGHVSHSTRAKRSSEFLRSSHRVKTRASRKAALVHDGVQLGEALVYSSLHLPVTSDAVIGTPVLPLVEPSPRHAPGKVRSAPTKQQSQQQKTPTLVLPSSYVVTNITVVLCSCRLRYLLACPTRWIAA